MNVCYCDLCGLPVHGKRFYLVVVSDDPKPGGQRVPQSKEQYEIDESCYKLLCMIFDLKKERIAEVKKFLDETYKLPANRKKKTKKRRGGKVYFRIERKNGGK